MYVAVTLVLVGEAILFESATLLVYAALVVLMFHLFIVCYEEPTLRQKFGEPYEQYCRHVRRWVPRFRAAPRN